MNLHELEDRFENHKTSWPDNREASVLIPLIEKEGEIQLLFEVRSSSIVQGGDICFPGGGKEEGETSEETAVREACEELLVSQDHIKVIAPMHRLVGPGGVIVTSFLGEVKDYAGTWSKDEIDHVFTLPLEHFLQKEPEVFPAEKVAKPASYFPYEYLPAGRNYHFIPEKKEYRFYRTGQGTIWGLTADVIYCFVQMLRKE